jgi:hypothetical protein
MSSAARSVPPPALVRAKTLSSSTDTSGVRRVDPLPLEPSHPRECESFKAGDKKAVNTLNRVFDKRGVKNLRLANKLDCPETVLRAVRAGERRKPFKVGLLYAIAECGEPQLALATLDEIRLDILLLAHGE